MLLQCLTINDPQGFNFNQIDMVKNGALVNLPNLLQVDLHANGIKIIQPGVFNNLPSLNYIRLSYNQIESFEARTFHNLRQLTIVDLEHNRLKVFDKRWFRDTPSLFSHNLANNLIRVIPNWSFDNLPMIWNLDLTSNQIKHIDREAFYGLDSLKELFLGNNRLQTLHVDFGSLETLAVPLNNLTYIPEMILRATENTIKMFSVYQNALQCPCFDKVVRWSDRHKIEDPFRDMSNSDNPVCVALLDNQTECVENLDEEASRALNKIFFEIYVRL